MPEHRRRLTWRDRALKELEDLADVMPAAALTAFARKEGAAGPFRPDFRAVIETDDGAAIMVEWHGYGRAYQSERRQIVGSVFHLADREPYNRLNDAVLRLRRRGSRTQRSRSDRTRSGHRCGRVDLGAHRRLMRR